VNREVLIITFWTGRDIVIVIVVVVVVRFPVVGFVASEERAESEDLVNGRGWFCVWKPVGRFGGRRTVVVVVVVTVAVAVVVATLFCGEEEEPLVQAQGADPEKKLSGVEIAE